MGFLSSIWICSYYFNFIIFFSFFKKKIKLFFKKAYTRTRILQRNPQKNGLVDRVRITTPRKPNSAKRKTVKVLYFHLIKPSISYIPGCGHNLKKHSKVLVRGGGARDLPGVYTSVVRGRGDLMGVLEKTKRRSIYGVKKSK